MMKLQGIMKLKLKIIFSVAYFEEQLQEVIIILNNCAINYQIASKFLENVYNIIIIIHCEN